MPTFVWKIIFLMKYDVFISYSRKDLAVADRILPAECEKKGG